MRKLAAVALASAAFLGAGNAFASYHLMNIVEVNVGTDSYVELEMWSDGQNFLGTHSITVFSSANQPLDTVNLANVANGAKHARVLIGTSSVEAKFGVKPDFATLKVLPPSGGRVCFDTIDCFSWGDHPVLTSAPAKPTDTGNAFQFTAGKVAKRDVSGGATTDLDGAGEDTNDSKADFDAADAAPKNNAKPDAGSTTSSSSSTSTSSSSSSSSSGSSSSSSGTASSASSGGTSGTSGASGSSGTSGENTTSSSSTGGAAVPESDDSGCNTSGESTSYAALPLLGLAVAALVRRRRRA